MEHGIQPYLQCRRYIRFGRAASKSITSLEYLSTETKAEVGVLTAAAQSVRGVAVPIG